MPYLRNDTAEHLLVAIGRLSPTGSRFAADHAGGATDSLLCQAQAVSSLETIADMWKGGLTDDVAGWLAQDGWNAQTVQGQSLAARYGRGRGPGLHGVFVTAQRR